MIPGFGGQMPSLTNQTSSATGDQKTGAVNFGGFNAAQDSNSLSKYALPALIALAAFYIISNKRR